MKTKIFLNARRLMLAGLAMLTIGVSQMWATDVTFTAGTDKSNTTSIEKGGITISFSDGTFSRDDNYRCYASNSMTITGTNITQIQVTCTGSGTANYGPGKFTKDNGSSGTYSYSGTVGTWSYASGATSITLNASAQVRITEIVVTYSGGTTYTVRWFDNSGQIGSDQEIDENSTSYTCPTSPTTAAPNCGDRFVGWTKGTYNTNATPPTILFTDDSGTKPAITEDTDFYAVFADYAE